MFFHFTLCFKNPNKKQEKMSDNIPLEIQSEIIKRLPVKSVVQCRSVSKLWKSLIDSSDFIKSYHNCKTHLFVRYLSSDYEIKFVSIADDDTFPNQISSLTVPHPVTLVATGPLTTIVSANGLLCFYGWRVDDMDNKMAVLWNPSIAKAVGIPISNPLRFPIGCTYVGFGVCPVTNDPKLVRINTIGYPRVNWEVEVYMLSTRVWKTVSNIPPAFKTCALTDRPVFIDGLIYWPAYDNTKLNRSRPDWIISFDLKSDEFGEVLCLPDSLVKMNGYLLKIYESLGFIAFDRDGDGDGDGEGVCDVWIMKKGVTKSFTKMLSIKADRMGNGVLHFRNNDEVIIETGLEWSTLEVYEPSSGRISSVGLNGCIASYSHNSYMETLLLLDESNSIIEDDDNV